MDINNAVVQEFFRLADYFERRGDIKSAADYKNDLAAFLQHARHAVSYDLVRSLCRGKDVLDIGCFAGYGEKRLAPVAHQVTAIDSDAGAIEFARGNYHFANVEFKLTDAKKLPFPDKSFDVVIAFQLIEHIRKNEVPEFLEEARRVLKDGGTLVVSTPNKKFRLGFLQLPFNIEHHQEFTAAGLYAILKKNFSGVGIKGLRAKNRIEDIEKARLKLPFFQGYVVVPLLRMAGGRYPEIFAKIFKKIRSLFSRKKDKNIVSKRADFFSGVKKFGMSDFYFNESSLDDSMELIAFCAK